MRYRVITRGRALTGFEPEYVRKGFAAHFQLSEDLTRDLFSGGKRFVIKSNLDLSTARAYVDRLADIGLEAEMQEMVGSGPAEAGEVLQLLNEQPRTTASDTIVCPSCGAYQSINLRCIYCGLVFDPPETTPRTALTRETRKPEKLSAPGSFNQCLAAAPKYPLAGAGPYVILGGAIFLTVMELIARFPILGALFALVTMGYLSAYMVQIVRTSANGRSSPPDWPDMGHWGHLLVPLFLVAITLAFSFSPAIVYLIVSEQWSSQGVTFWLLTALGIAYFPMAFLALVMTNLLRAITPIFVVPSILRVWRNYLVACVLMALVYFFSYVIRASVDEMPILGTLVNNALGVYFMLLEMRIIGILFLTNEETLNWFD